MKIKITKILFLVWMIFLVSQKVFSQTGQSIDTWVSMANATPTGNGAGACIVYAEKDGNPKIYNIRGGTTGFGIYDINTNVWVSTTALPYAASSGAAMTWDGGNFIYILLGGTTFYQFDISAATFTRLADPPGSVTSGGAIVYVSTSPETKWCYAFQGGTNVLWRYNINTNEWESLTGPGAATKSGSAMVWTGDEYIYCLVADASPVLRRYNINTNTWTNLANTPTTIGAGASIIWDGVITSSNIYALRGGAQISFWKYSISLNQWVWVSSVPATVGTYAGNKLARYGDYIYCRRGVTDDSFWRYRWRDVDPPGKITSFVAETGTIGGEINLSWVCPGNDNYTGNLPSGSTFYIQYASWTGVNFSTTTQPPAGGYGLYIPTGPVVQGSTVYYTIGGLQENDTYYFRIWAKDNAGNWSEISNGATAWAMYTTDTIPPDAISDLVSLPITQDNRIDLKWTSPGDDWDSGSLTGAYIVQYASETMIGTVVWQYSNAQVIISTTNITPGTTQHFSLTLSGGTTYYFRMWARDEAFNYSTISNGATIYLGIYPPAAVTNLTATVWNSTVGAVALQWTAPADPPSGGTVSRYIMRYATFTASSVGGAENWWNLATDVFGEPTPTSAGSLQIMTISGLPSGQYITFHIRSTDTVNNLSDIDNGTEQTVYVPPHLLISEVQFQTGNNDYIELYNPTDNPINLVDLGLSVHRRSSAGSDYTFNIEFLNQTIPAKGYFLIVSTPTYQPNGKLPDARLPHGASGTNNNISSDNSVYISLSATALVDVIDVIAFGSGTDTSFIDFGDPNAPKRHSYSGSATQSVERKPGGGAGSTLGNEFDTNRFDYDFDLINIDPQNSSDPTEPPPAIPNAPSWRQDLIEVNTGYIKWVIQDNATDEEALYISSDTNTGARLPGSFLGTLSGTGGTTSWIEINLSSNTKYTRYGEAYKTSGSSWSSGLTVCTLAYPPETVNLTPVNANTINISWNYSGASKYLIARSSSNFDAPWSTSAVILSPGTTHQDTGLLGNTTYWYRIYVYNQDDVLNQNFYSITVSTLTYPSAPTGFTKQQATPTSITWQWNSVSCDGYRIYRATDSSLIADQGSATTFTETGLSTNTAYGRFVRAYNIVGESLDSNHATFYTLAAAPVNLQITEVYSSSVTLVWEDGGNPSWTRYGVARAEDENFTVNHTTFVGLADNLTQLTTTVSGLGGNTTYYFRIWAYNGDGIESEYSNFVSTKTFSGAPAAPVGLYGIAVSSVSIKWEWNITVGATYYQIYNSAGDLLIANIEGAGNTTYIEINLSSNTQYGRYVKAGNAQGLSVKSDNANRYTLAYPPTNLTATVVSSSTINLGWNFSGATKYQVWYSTDLTNNYQAGSVNSPALSFTHQGLEAGVTYYYKIVPVNGDDIANYNFDFPVASTRTVPSPVVSFSTSAVTTVSITWIWTPATGADGYRVYRTTDNSLIADQGSATTFTETGLSTNTAYGRYVRAYNTSGLGELSPKTTVYTLATIPKGLEVVNVTTGSASLLWQNSGNPSWTRYEVSYSTDNFVLHFATAVKLSDNWVETSTTVFGLKQNTTYYFRVRAFNGDGVGTEFDSYVSTKTITEFLINENFDGPVFPPSGWARNNVALSTVTTRFISPPVSVAFSAEGRYLFTPLLENPGEVTFNLYATSLGSTFTLEVGTSQVTTGSWIVLLATGTTSVAWSTQTIYMSGYNNVYLRMSRTAGNATFNLDNFIVKPFVPDTKKPSAISNLSALTGPYEGQIQLSWTAPTDNDGETKPFVGNYVIKYSSVQIINSSDFDSPLFAHGVVIVSTSIAPNTAVSHTLTLSPGTSYWFAIKSTDTSGNVSVWRSSSDVSTINTAAYAWSLDTPPPVPTNFIATASENSILLTWDAVGVDDLDYYELRCDSTTPYDFVDEFIATTTKNTSFLHTGLENYVTYYYRLRAVDLPPTVLYSDYSVNVSTYPVPTIPFAPTLNYDLTETTTVQIKWILTDNSINETSLHISSGTNLGARVWSSDALSGFGGTTSYLETGFSPNQQVVRYAEAYNAVGSSWSVGKIVWTKANVPTGLNVVGTSKNSVSLSWSNNNNPSWTRYEVSYSTDNFVLHFATAVKLSDNWVETSTTVTSLLSGTNYKFRVRAFNQNDIPTNFIEISTTTSITGNLLLNEFFEEWVITSSESAKFWAWSGAAGNLKRSTQALVGAYSAETRLTSSEDNLFQFGIVTQSNITYYAEVWVKGTGKARVGIVKGDGSPATYGTQVTLNNDDWTKISHSRYDNVGGNNAGIRIAVVRNTTTGEKLYIGAAWFSDAQPPSSWPPVPPPDTIPPCSISNLTALAGNLEGSVKLSWTSPGDDGDTGTLNNAVYRIKYSTTSFTFFSSTDSYSVQFTTTGVPSKTAVSYTVGGLNPGTTYYFGIIARDDAGNWSIWTKDSETNIVNYSAATDLPPAIPFNFTASGLNRSVDLSWSNPSPDPGDIDKYWIYQATFSFTTVAEDNVVHVATVAYPSVSKTITGLTNGVIYYYRIKSLDKGDQGNGLFSIVLDSELSNPISAVPRLRPASNLIATHQGTKVSLSWTHSIDYSADNFAGYNIYRSEEQYGVYNFVGSVSKTAGNSFVDTAQVVSNKTYYYIVRSSDTIGVESIDSNIATAIPDLIAPEFVLIEKLSTRSLGKSLAKISLKVVDDRFVKEDREGKIVSLTGKYRKINDTLSEQNIIFVPEFVSGANEYIGEAEFDFNILQIGTDGVEYYLVARDEVNITSWPVSGGWYKVELPPVLPEQKFVSVTNPEIVFGKEVEEVVIRDYSGNELWKGSSNGGTQIIVWRGEDKQNKKIESGGYVYEIRTKDGKKKYGVVIVVK